MKFRSKCKVYCLIDPRNNNPFYVGVSVNPHARLSFHIVEARYWQKQPRVLDSALKWMRIQLIRDIILNAQMEVKIKIISTVLIENAQMAERKTYKRYTKMGYILLQEGGKAGAANISKLLKREIKKR